jgi:hypothetical protein
LGHISKSNRNPLRAFKQAVVSILISPGCRSSGKEKKWGLPLQKAEHTIAIKSSQIDPWTRMNNPELGPRIQMLILDKRETSYQWEKG